MSKFKTLDQCFDWLEKDMKRVHIFREHIIDAATDDLSNFSDEEYLACLRDVFLNEEVNPCEVFSALCGWDICDITDRVKESFVDTDTYRVELSLANLRHKPWWTWGDIPQIYTFDSLDETVRFLANHHLVRQQDIEFIQKQDGRLESGRLCCTSWYTVTKGEEQMTEYTSL